MHPAQYYALKIGSKIQKPNIYEKYQPIPYNKFILINLKEKEYKYWQEAIDLLENHLRIHGINIIQIINNTSEGLKKTNYFINKNDINISTYLCHQALMYVGEPSIEMHISSIFNKKILAVHNFQEENNICPYWSKKNKLILLKNNKNLWPETIAQNILKLLNIKEKISIKTNFIGEKFCYKKIEVIPNDIKFDIDRVMEIENHIIRMDLNFNEAFLNEFLHIKKSIILTKKPINLEIIKKHKEKILNIVYLIDLNFDLEFVKNIKNLGINYSFISSEIENNLEKIKFKLMDYGSVNKKETEKLDPLLYENKSLFFKTSKILYDGINFYSSEYHYKNKLPRQEIEKVIPNDEFLNSAEDLYIFSID
jgi:hypothetical protein